MTASTWVVGSPSMAPGGCGGDGGCGDAAHLGFCFGSGQVASGDRGEVAVPTGFPVDHFGGCSFGAEDIGDLAFEHLEARNGAAHDQHEEVDRVGHLGDERTDQCSLAVAGERALRAPVTSFAAAATSAARPIAPSRATVPAASAAIARQLVSVADVTRPALRRSRAGLPDGQAFTAMAWWMRREQRGRRPSR